MRERDVLGGRLGVGQVVGRRLPEVDVLFEGWELAVEVVDSEEGNLKNDFEGSFLRSWLEEFLWLTRNEDEIYIRTQTDVGRYLEKSNLLSCNNKEICIISVSIQSSDVKLITMSRFTPSKKRVSQKKQTKTFWTDDIGMVEQWHRNESLKTFKNEWIRKEFDWLIRQRDRHVIDREIFMSSAIVDTIASCNTMQIIAA